MTNGIVCKDHKGIEYPSVVKMCEAYGICRATYQKRIERGLSVEEALTGPKTLGHANKCVDHLGNEYPSESQMCKAYDINFFTYRERKMKGWSVKDCLTTPLTDRSECFSKECEDHLGQKFKSESDMARHWGVTPNLLAGRKSHRWTLKKALTTPPKDTTVQDYLGNKYPTIEAMCEAYGLTKYTYDRRQKRGWDLEKILTTPVKETSCEDHKGIKYASMEEMARTYGLQGSTVKYRLKRGWTLEEALTSSRNLNRDTNPYTCIDHKGITYPSKKAMCKAYGVSYSAFTSRINKGLSLEKALTNHNPGEIQDHKGKWYKNANELAKAYGLNTNTLLSRLYHGMDIETALTMKVGGGRTSPEDMKKKWEGMTRQMYCGLNATVKEYINNQKIVVEFEDGECKVTDLRSFENGNVAHPGIRNGNFYGYKCVYDFTADGMAYYKVKNLRTGEKNLTTLRKLI